MVNLETVTLLFAATTTLADPPPTRPLRPITLSRTGGFNIGGKILPHPVLPNETLSCDHGYLEYFIPWRPRKTSLVMWHSSSTQVWQNRWDGGEGYKDMFLRRNYPVWLWDGPRVGRANWACEPTSYTPSFTSDHANFAAWNFGPRYKQWWPDVQFPTTNDTAWQQATSNRYVEYDTKANVELHSDAAAIAADSGKIGNNIVYLTNSAGGLRAMMTTTKANGTNIKGIVTYESIGYVFPDNVNITAGTGGFGPFVVPLEKFKKLAKVPGIQFIWGDHRPENHTSVMESRLCASLINKYGGNAKVVKLGELRGLKGSTHIPFADLSNGRVAALLDEFLEENGLDEYEDGDDWN
ncbi:alpha/beta-hydrolase [Westerdykella ornata]|uniref:Alpha/beta-hydrolase n=1 Tax=Westerdykella ornata TaxID=318751 RepID=A0A6A6JV28_WESOR|nr:alpha/beta-hydrolase [Westerdykella ornata]KAF2280471.1 alpha/beta-hydrolase [Westerdykella ornata]